MILCLKRDLAFMPMQNRTRLKIQLVRDDFVTSFFKAAPSVALPSKDLCGSQLHLVSFVVTLVKRWRQSLTIVPTY